MDVVNLLQQVIDGADSEGFDALFIHEGLPEASDACVARCILIVGVFAGGCTLAVAFYSFLDDVAHIGFCAVA